ncbi:hypothetical protein BGZ51_008246 [Haplosporangium sp. Z 767]|nr:hypothetical protein BGZ51_008246 [Haplosporangium sp. Z 767]
MYPHENCLQNQTHVDRGDTASPITPIPTGSCVFMKDTASDQDLPEGMVAGTGMAEPDQEDASKSLTHTPATLRKFQNHYIDLLSYLKGRQERLNALKKIIGQKNVSPSESDLVWREYRFRERAMLRQRRTRTQAIQFQILTQVGQGGFGEVFLARKADTNELCALKRMSKKRLHLQDEVQHILTERDVLTSTRSEWHVKLLYSFQDREYVYLAMEFVPGGDLRTMLTARGVLREEDTRLYFAEMVMAIDALHQQGYIHRDLKPENFLIDRMGHIKLTDFGLSKGQLAEGRIEALKSKLKEVKDNMEPTQPFLRRNGGGSSLMLHPHPHGGGLEGAMAGSRLGGAGGSFANLNGILHRSPSHLLRYGSNSNLANNSLLDLHQANGSNLHPQQHHPREYKNEGIHRAFSIVGSADYMAPEVLANKGYDYGVDYWSLGCILFEFLCGYSPFQAEDTQQTCVNVWHWRKVLQRPMYDTEENLEFNLTDEAWDLITKLIDNRENRYTTLQQVKSHPWLSGMNWNNLRSMPTSFVPVLSSPVDTSYFDDFSNPEDMVGYKDVMLRQAQVRDAEEAAASAKPAFSGQEETDDSCMSQSTGTLPYILRVQDPWKGAFVGFTFRHHHQYQCQS